MTRVAFLGLGAMGAPMARRILAAGFPLNVWNRSPERARAIEGAVVAQTPREAASAADVVCTMLSDPAALEAVTAGPDGLIAGLSPGKIWLDFSTVTPEASRRAEKAAREKGADFCDVPVAGSVKPATDGTLTLLAGGDPSVLERVGPVLSAVSSQTLRFGDVGQGSAMKLVNNLMFGVTLAGFGEALALGKALGLPDEKTRAWLLSTPSIPPYVKTKMEFLAAGGEPAAFQLALMEKDLRLMVEAAGGPSASPVVEAAREDFERARRAGMGEKDMAHLIPFLLGARP
jgi:3-hydroxyisobutyrate dehydrogenase-like beta-hydroxyacid dehydrogenase